MEACIEEIRQWMHENHLKLNNSKTEFLTLGSKHQLSQLGSISIRIGEDQIISSNNARNIGVVFDQHMEMREQVANIACACYAQLRSIARVWRYLTNEAAERLIHAFITSRLDNHNSILYGIPDFLIDKMQLIQNQAACIICRLKKNDHITTTLINLHWLPVKQRIEYKMLLFAYKAQHSVAPVYLADLLLPYVPSRSLRSENQTQLEQPIARSKRYGGSSFSVAAPKLRNDLPNELKESTSLSNFKTTIKTYLFKKAYNL